jgi:hypothetical protein
MSVSAIGFGSTSEVDSGSGLVPCAIVGSSTGSADSCGVTLRFLRARLAGQGRSGLESHGSYVKLAFLYWSESGRVKGPYGSPKRY